MRQVAHRPKVDILPVQGITASAQIVAPACAGACDGSISVVPSNGIAPYSYLWTPAQGRARIGDRVTALRRAWSVTVTDAVGCDTTLSFVLTDPAPFMIDLVTTRRTAWPPVLETAAVTVSGGTRTPTFFWQPDPGTGQGTSSVTGFALEPRIR